MNNEDSSLGALLLQILCLLYKIQVEIVGIVTKIKDKKEFYSAAKIKTK